MTSGRERQPSSVGVLPTQGSEARRDASRNFRLYRTPNKPPETPHPSIGGCMEMEDFLVIVEGRNNWIGFECFDIDQILFGGIV